LIALHFANHADLEKQGRPFRCHICQNNSQTGKPRDSIAKSRRCYEDRWDFDEKDGSSFPIQMTKGGPTFGFCPAKVSRDDSETLMIFQTLIAILETGTWPDKGGINDQEFIWVELVSDFGPYLDELKFSKRLGIIAELVSSAFGSPKSAGGLKNGSGKK
jgi:hypothetical protein